MPEYHAYVLLSKKSGKLYKGHTDDLERRLSQHNDPDSDSRKFAPKHAPWMIIHSERFETRTEAMAREKFLKSGRGRDWLKNNVQVQW